MGDLVGMKVRESGDRGGKKVNQDCGGKVL